MHCNNDVEGHVTCLNLPAERLTGWPNEDAHGCAVELVLRIFQANSHTRVTNPMALSIERGTPTTLPPGCILLRRDGTETRIEGSTSPIHDRRGALISAALVFRDVTTAHALSAKMAPMAHHDSLTDLPNRLLLGERLIEAIAGARQHGKALALLYLDVDRFKYINDSLGHPAGDRLLQALAWRLRQCVRDSDTVSRAGGDEFAVLLREIAAPEDAALAASKLLEEVRRPFVISGVDIQVTASIGIATYPADGMDDITLSKTADIALCQSKDSGRDRYQFFSPNVNDRVVERQTLEADLGGTVNGRHFILYYQPKVDLTTGLRAGVEALIRWQHPKRGLKMPSQFIELVEDTALIVPIGRWVLGEACRQTRAWHEAGESAASVAVNVSAVELRATGFVESMRTILQETGAGVEASGDRADRNLSDAGFPGNGNHTREGERHGGTDRAG